MADIEIKSEHGHIIIETFDQEGKRMVAQVIISVRTGQIVDGFNIRTDKDSDKKMAIYCSEEATL